MQKIHLLENVCLANISDEQWHDFRPGVDILPITGEPTTAGSSALLRYQPGATVPAHVHRGVEHILVLSGSQQDQNGRHETGSLVVNEKDTQHSVSSDEGCIVLAVWCGDLEVLPPSP